MPKRYWVMCASGLSIWRAEISPSSTANTASRLWLTANSTDMKKFARNLRPKGSTFQTRTDSEILIFLYLEYGMNLFTHLRGEFSFALYDEPQDILLVGRDRFGIKPLYYYQDDERLLIASEAKALFALGIDSAWDEYSFMHAATMQYQPTDRTLFRNIRQLSPGHWMRYQNQLLSICKYWDLDYRTESDTLSEVSDETIIEQFKALLSESIQLRLVSDVPVCFHLSGGLDSSSVVALAAPHLNRPPPCFTVTFQGKEGYDELELAQTMARFTDSELHVVDISPEDILSHLEDAVYYSEGLAINGHITSKYLLNRAIGKAGFKVALTGEGADELLAGYPHLRQDLLREVSIVEQENVLKTLYETNLVSIGVQLAQGDHLDVKALEGQLGFVPAFLQAKASFGYKMHSILSDEFLEHYHAVNFHTDMLGAYDIETQLRGKHPVNQSLYLWTKLTLANYILNTLGDGCEMASSIEGRLPFLDHHLFEFIRTLPVSLKIRQGVEKYILKEAVKSRIPDTIYRRQKHPFMAPPVTQCLSHQNRDFLMAI